MFMGVAILTFEGFIESTCGIVVRLVWEASDEAEEGLGFATCCGGCVFQCVG